MVHRRGNPCPADHEHLLSNLDTGGLLGAADNPAEEVQRRIRIQTVGAREFHLDDFQAVGSALLRRKRLVMRYHARGTDEATEREISPQRLNHYRDNWYLDAWCHLRDGLPAFAVDAIEHAEILDKRARDVADNRIDEVRGSGYGAFSGEQVAWSVLRFTPERARWVAAERWHRRQEGIFFDDGRYDLRVPYADDRELIMDIMKYGSACQSVRCASLRKRFQPASSGNRRSRACPSAPGKLQTCDVPIASPARRAWRNPSPSRRATTATTGLKSSMMATGISIGLATLRSK